MATTSTSSATYTKNVAPTTDAIKDVRQKYADLFNEVNAVYVNLTNAGRTQEAMALRESAEKFARTGSEAGISPMARVAALDRLKATMRGVGASQESQDAASALARKESILGGLAGATKDVYNAEYNAYSQKQADTQAALNRFNRGGTTSVNPAQKATGSEEAVVRQAAIQAASNARTSNPTTRYSTSPVYNTFGATATSSPSTGFTAPSFSLNTPIASGPTYGAGQTAVGTGARNPASAASTGSSSGGVYQPPTSGTNTGYIKDSKGNTVYLNTPPQQATLNNLSKMPTNVANFAISPVSSMLDKTLNGYTGTSTTRATVAPTVTNPYISTNKNPYLVPNKNPYLR